MNTTPQRYLHQLSRLALCGASLAVFLLVPNSSNAQTEVPTGTVGARTLAPRISLFVRDSRDVPFDDTVVTVLVVDTEVVTAEIMGERTVRLRGLDFGETLVIVVTPRGRRTLIVEVVGHPLTSPFAGRQADASSGAGESGPISGAYMVSFSPPLNGSRAFLSQHLDYRHKLGPNRTLRVSSDMFKIFGSKDTLALPLAPASFGINQFSVGVSTSEGELDLLDSDLNISPLSFNGYALRGLHLVSARESRLRGLEVFAGLARPPLTLFGGENGRVLGAMMPLAQTGAWRVRAGFTLATPQSDKAQSKGGMIWQTNARYHPDDETDAEAEVALANGAFSWRAALALRRGAFNFAGEASHLDRRSPLISVGAQSSGRTAYNAALQWQPTTRFIGTASYSRVDAAPISSSNRASTLNNSTLLAGASYYLNRDSNVSFRYAQQQLASGANSSSRGFKLDTRSFAASYSTRFAKRWSNNFEARYSLSRETSAKAEMERGWSVRNELNRSWEQWSATAFVNYTHNTPSLANLLLQDPELLPPPLRSAFEADPAHFLIVYRDLLPQLLSGVELPQTRSADVGLRLQGAFSRYILLAETRYSSGEIMAREYRNLLTTLSVTARLDAANSIGVSAMRAFDMHQANTTGGVGTSALTVSYTHRFGASSGGGFQFGKLLGLDRGRLKGRVFHDLNSNGRDDPEEPGLANAKIQLDDGHSIMTDEQGRFRFGSVTRGAHTVSLMLDELGMTLRASTATEQHVSVSARETVEVSFGVTNHGFIAGRIFNNLSLADKPLMTEMPGVMGVRVKLRPEGTQAADAVRTETVDGDGEYEFRNLAPGDYTLELDLESLPPDYQPPAQTSWQLKVVPLHGSYKDIPLAAQRAVSGIVFRDKDGDGQFDAEKDETVEGARVVAGSFETLSGRGGSYILRHLPAGKLELRALTPESAESRGVSIELDEEPVARRRVNVSITR